MKTVIVTGANSGLGLWTTKYLLDLDYRVIMACRHTDKTKKAIADFPEFDKNKQYMIKKIDLSDFASIRNFVHDLNDFKEIYGLDCNAGITYEGEFRYAKNGIEETFATNYLGHFLLTNLLLEKFNLERIVMVSSALHDPKIKAPFTKAVFRPIHDLAYPQINTNLTLKKQAQEFYTTSKLCNILFGYELDRRLKNRNIAETTLINSINPGFMPDTNFGRSHKTFERLTRKLLKLMGTILGFVDIPQVSAKAVVALFQQDSDSGKYFDKMKEIHSSVDSYNTEFAKTLWEGSEALVGSKFLN
jgi:NAD(P)-dependent dehydrogenase (short-subunit alcohol dehydrogenase family)